MLKIVTVAGFAASLTVGSAYAQGQPGAVGGSGPFIAKMPNTLMRLSEVIGVDVIGSDEHKLGKVDDVLVDREGRVEAVVIGAGGFLGLGEKRVAVPFGSLRWNTGDATQISNPSASLAPADAPPQEASAPPERLPGAQVSAEALRSDRPEQSGTVNPDTGPVTTSSTVRDATVLVVPPGGPVRAVSSLAKADIERAPEFRYEAGAGQR